MLPKEATWNCCSGRNHAAVPGMKGHVGAQRKAAIWNSCSEPVRKVPGMNQHVQKLPEGHLEILKWARSQGCPWNGLTCAWAAEGGHLELLQCYTHNTFLLASRCDRMNVLVWAHQSDYPCWDQRIYTEAKEAGHWDILRWAKRKGLSLEDECENNQL